MVEVLERVDAMVVERALRVQLAGAYRAVAHFGWSSFLYNHLTVRVPGPATHFLINPFGLFYEEVTASSLVKVDLDGNVVEPGVGLCGGSINKAGFVIHSAIHRGREDAHCVMHIHTTAAFAVASLEDGLMPLTLESMAYDGKVGYHDYEGVTLEPGEGERLVEHLGGHRAMILRNHGLLTAGRTIAEAMSELIHLQVACEAQVAALSCGRPLHRPSVESIERTASLGRKFGDETTLARSQLEFDAVLRLMERVSPGFDA